MEGTDKIVDAGGKGAKEGEVGTVGEKRKGERGKLRSEGIRRGKGRGDEGGEKR